MQYILYVTNTSLQIFNQKSQLAQFSFPENTVLYQEIRDETTFKEALTALLLSLNLAKGKVIMALADELVFFQQTTTTDKELLQKESEAFFNYVPIDPADIAKKIFSEKDTTYFVAIHGKFVRQIQTIFAIQGLHTEAVIPASFMGITGAQPLAMQAIYEHQSLINRFNLLSNIQSLTTKDAKDAIPSESKHTISKKQYSVLGVSVLLLSIVVLFAINRLTQPSQPSDTSQKPAIATTTVTPKLSPSPPTAITTEKKDLTINILNGSGKVGQANEVKTVLETNGFQNISTGNEPISPNAKTSLTLDPSIEKVLEEELTALLQKSFADLSVLKASESGTFAIVIVTR